VAANEESVTREIALYVFGALWLLFWMVQGYRAIRQRPGWVRELLLFGGVAIVLGVLAVNAP
jgi:hypothetical protein